VLLSSLLSCCIMPACKARDANRPATCCCCCWNDNLRLSMAIGNTDHARKLPMARCLTLKPTSTSQSAAHLASKAHHCSANLIALSMCVLPAVSVKGSESTPSLNGNLTVRQLLSIFVAVQCVQYLWCLGITYHQCCVVRSAVCTSSLLPSQLMPSANCQ
jgi:hypothetical protein